MEDVSFAIVCGDMRSYELAKILIEKGHRVKLYGFNALNVQEKITGENSIKDAVKDVDVVITPIPMTRDGININAPYDEGDIPIEELFRSMNEDQVLIGGKTGACMAMKESYGIKVVDIMDREEMAVLNAIPTAEGALQLALEEMKTTIHGSESLVLGFGRIGKVMANLLKAVGSEVSVLARKHSDISWIKVYGYTPVYIYDLKKALANTDLIINTIPKVILNEGLLKEIEEDTLIIDLASMPGGIEYGEVQRRDLKVIHALGLPGKVAPVSSARYMVDVIYNIIEEWEV